jgi:hypothetical protein
MENHAIFIDRKVQYHTAIFSEIIINVIFQFKRKGTTIKCLMSFYASAKYIQNIKGVGVLKKKRKREGVQDDRTYFKVIEK